VCFAFVAKQNLVVFSYFFQRSISLLLTHFYGNNLLKQRDCVKGDKIISFNELRISEWDSRDNSHEIFLSFSGLQEDKRQQSRFSFLGSERKSIHICHVNSIFAYARYNVPSRESEVKFISLFQSNDLRKKSGARI
jgi:hypothetical protein